jgi:hypothetical protein
MNWGVLGGQTFAQVVADITSRKKTLFSTQHNDLSSPHAGKQGLGFAYMFL